MALLVASSSHECEVGIEEYRTQWSDKLSHVIDIVEVTLLFFSELQVFPIRYSEPPKLVQKNGPANSCDQW